MGSVWVRLALTLYKSSVPAFLLCNHALIGETGGGTSLKGRAVAGEAVMDQTVALLTDGDTLQNHMI